MISKRISRNNIKHFSYEGIKTRKWKNIPERWKIIKLYEKFSQTGLIEKLDKKR